MEMDRLTNGQVCLLFNWGSSQCSICSPLPAIPTGLHMFTSTCHPPPLLDSSTLDPTHSTRFKLPSCHSATYSKSSATLPGRAISCQVLGLGFITFNRSKAALHQYAPNEADTDIMYISYPSCSKRPGVLILRVRLPRYFSHQPRKQI
jgi:hypothetical protein